MPAKAKKKQDVKKLLSQAKLPRKMVNVCTRGDLVVEAQRLEDELKTSDVARGKGPSRLAGAKSPVVEVAKKLEAIQAEMLENTLEFELEAFSSRRWREMKTDHPMGKEPSQLDIQFGADVNSLLEVAIPESVVSPELDDEDWERLAEVLVDGEINRLAAAVLNLNEEGTKVPFSLLASAILQAQSDVSKSQKPSGERPAS